MKGYKEMAESVFQRRDAYVLKKQKQKALALRVGVPAICIAFVAVLGLSIHKLQLRDHIQAVPPISSSILVQDVNSQSIESITADSSSPSSSQSEITATLPSSQIDNSISNEQQIINSVVTPNGNSTTQTTSGITEDQSMLTSCAPNYGSPSMVPPDKKDPIIVGSLHELVKYLELSNLPASKPSQTSSNTSSETTVQSSRPPQFDGTYPEAEPSAPTASVPTYLPDKNPMFSITSDDIDVLQSVWTLFESGSFVMPNGLDTDNSPVYINRILIDPDAVCLRYQYRWKDFSHSTNKNYDLSINVYANRRDADKDIKIYGTAQTEILEFHGIRYACVKHDGFYFIYWQEGKSVYTAQLYGTKEELTQILQMVSMESYIWNS